MMTPGTPAHGEKGGRRAQRGFLSPPVNPPPITEITIRDGRSTSARRWMASNAGVRTAPELPRSIGSHSGAGSSTSASAARSAAAPGASDRPWSIRTRAPMRAGESS